ncbi:Retrovirus-related Pol polyprotein from transposon RE2 [Vitis vinifera]|uniref:Retrovirus-related Pol polyprotein from transposon RE2 n=1 Tax=Vitis vinifera TaxID=29760 RepID=A0A438H714_VITVI|nr:Retrovirus-related Pol polyprotein from transposon RE2 [Vitis vinifera]
MAFNASSPVATASSHNKPRHERPICTHCGLTGHTIDRSFTEPLKGIHYFPSAAAATVGSFPPLVSLPSNQVQQLIAYLSTHLQQQTIDPFESPSTSGPSISQIYGATHHVCCNISLFSHSRLVHNTTVTLPNGHVVAINRVVHIDIWGPFNVSTPGGHRYYLTIVDDCTRATWGYKLLDLESNKIYISRNVIFHESLFPFAHSAAIESQVWCDAMNIELQALESNDTWYKARFVAKGFTQQEGIDYLDTFSLVAKLVTVKMLLSLATIHGWSLTQLDVTNAFLHGDLMEEVYMSLPPGYTCHEGNICLLMLCAGCIKGFVQSTSDHTLFTKHQDTSFLALLIYIDGIIIASNDQLAVDTLKHALNCKFKMKDLGPLRYFLGLEVA